MCWAVKLDVGHHCHREVGEQVVLQGFMGPGSPADGHGVSLL